MNLVKFSRRIAEKVFLPEDTVRMVLEAAFDVLPEAVLEEPLVFPGFGRFKLIRKRSPESFRKYREIFHYIQFKAAPALKAKVVKGPAMNKYSVVLDGNKTVTGQLTGLCPDCNEKLESINPPKCPRCGTKPFESKPTPADNGGNDAEG
jgi:nucleoid DNA-binding protein